MLYLYMIWKIMKNCGVYMLNGVITTIVEHIDLDF
jgi:hypothetical protein